ncbi:UNVERIFIED_CONTAM: hypothetical protein GTU68_022173 [Idotea baltica]|nr:hypothetical protein [Idotea baltica]
MLAIAASRLGMHAHIFDPAEDAPAKDVAAFATTADYTNQNALVDFAQQVDVITYEFENIPTQALDVLETHRPIRPGRLALATSQDRLVEKEFLHSLDLATAPFRDITSQDSLTQALDEIGPKGILKTRRFGYDGKGQIRLDQDADLTTVMADLSGSPAILEGFVDFTHEVSVIAARSFDGAVACYDPGENVHRDGILHTTRVPARLSAAQRTDAVLIAAKILNALDYVGVLGVELFVTGQGLVVNEIAPRVHNSGHWTQNGCMIDQFEQHIRAVAGWPLGDGTRHSDIEMENLIGSDMDALDGLARDAGAALHLYGKAVVKPGRKMGHVNRVLRSNG